MRNFVLIMRASHKKWLRKKRLESLPFMGMTVAKSSNLPANEQVWYRWF